MGKLIPMRLGPLFISLVKSRKINLSLYCWRAAGEDAWIYPVQWISISTRIDI